MISGGSSKSMPWLNASTSSLLKTYAVSSPRSAAVGWIPCNCALWHRASGGHAVAATRASQPATALGRKGLFGHGRTPVRKTCCGICQGRRSFRHVRLLLVLPITLEAARPVSKSSPGQSHQRANFHVAVFPFPTLNAFWNRNQQGEIMRRFFVIGALVLTMALIVPAALLAFSSTQNDRQGASTAASESDASTETTDSNEATATPSPGSACTSWK